MALGRLESGPGPPWRVAPGPPGEWPRAPLESGPGVPGEWPQAPLENGPGPPGEWPLAPWRVAPGPLESGGGGRGWGEEAVGGAYMQDALQRSGDM